MNRRGLLGSLLGAVGASVLPEVPPTASFLGGDALMATGLGTLKPLRLRGTADHTVWDSAGSSLYQYMVPAPHLSGAAHLPDSLPPYFRGEE